MVGLICIGNSEANTNDIKKRRCRKRRARHCKKIRDMKRYFPDTRREVGTLEQRCITTPVPFM